MHSNTNSGISSIDADSYIKVCPTCGQVIPNDRAEEVLHRHHQLEAKTKAAGIKEAKAEAEATTQAKLAEMSGAKDAEKVEAVNAVKAEEFQKQLKLIGQVQDLQRSLEKKNTNDLGDGAEVDLLKHLEAAFPNDRISRVARGVPGADVHQVVVHNGKEIGTIIYDSKNRKAWQWDCVAKLCADQMAAKADYAILSTWKLPAGKHEVMEHNGVLIAKPPHVVFLAGVVRGFTVKTASLRAAGKDVSGKRVKLFALVTSNQFGQKLKSFGTIAADMQGLDAKEKTQHEKNWKDRGKLIAALKAASDAIAADIDDIIGREDEEDEDD